MVYDNTKFHIAFDRWLDERVDVGFGRVYTGDLLEDFVDFCRETKALKASPGRVIFGKRMRERGFERRKVAGVTYWTGLELKNQRQVAPVRYAPTVERTLAIHAEQVALQQPDPPERRAAELERFQAELAEEERRLKELEDA